MKPQTVIVSCAPPGIGNGGNIGMNTVDLAIHAIAKERGLTDRVLLYRPWEPYFKDGDGHLPRGAELDQWPMRVRYEIEQLGPPGPLEAVLSWGDFQHGLDYQHRSAKRMQRVYRQRGQDKTIEECLERCFSYFLLDGRLAEPPTTHLAMFGGTLFQNRVPDYLDERYHRLLSRLYRGAQFVRVRDPYSAGKVSELRDDYQSSYFGVDAAMLNHREDLLALDRSNTRELQDYQGAVGLFFGRSSKSFPLLGASKFVNSICRQMNKEPAWISWNRHTGGFIGSSYGRMKWFLRSLRCISEKIDITSGDVLSSIDSVSLVVTDTYHLAINAIVMGTPAVLVYEPSPDRMQDANMGFRQSWRDKRALFYLSYDLSDFLVASTDLSDRRFRHMRASNIVERLKDPMAMAGSHAGLLAVARDNRRAVGDYLTSLLDDHTG